MTLSDLKNTMKSMFPAPYLVKMARLPSGIDGRLLIYTDPLSNIAEQFRSLRTNLYFMQPDNPIRILAITSGEPSEGKTTVSSNLAAALALDNKKVLLIDGDLRRPNVHEFFGLSRSPGLSEALERKAPIKEIYRKLDLGNLHVMTAGEPVSNPAEFIGRTGLKNRFELLLEALRADFDYIIVDTPPSRVITDGCLMASMCDAVFLVVKANVSQRDSIEATATQLRNAKANLMASVLINYPTKPTDYYGYGVRSQASLLKSPV